MPLLSSWSSLDLLIAFVGQQDQPDRRLLAGLHIVLFQPPQIELHLSFVSGLEAIQFQIDGDQSPKFAVVEQQIRR